ncbi:MAG: hypothetical protein ACXADY_10515 [Candidatus Hodarchaeales archaeon]
MFCNDKSLLVKGVKGVLVFVIIIHVMVGLAILVGAMTGILPVPDDFLLVVGVFAIFFILRNIPIKRLWDHYKNEEMVENILIAFTTSLLSILIAIIIVLFLSSVSPLFFVELSLIIL